MTKINDNITIMNVGTIRVVLIQLLLLHSNLSNSFKLPFQTQQSSLSLISKTPSASVHSSSGTSTRSQLYAKKKKNQRDTDTFNNWYDKVDQDATPDDIFWEEMERQKLYSNQNNDESSSSSMGMSSSSIPSMKEEFNVVSSLEQISTGAGRGQKVGLREEIMEQKSMEAVLKSFDYAMCDDNFLGDQDHLMYDDGGYVSEENDVDIDEENRRLDEQYEGLENGEDDDDDLMDYSKSSMFLSSFDEPWDTWGEEDDDGDVIKIDDKDSEYLLENDFVDTEDDIAEEMEYLASLSTIQIHSPRLTAAANSPKSKAFFAQPPNTREGYDRTWVSAIDPPCLSNLYGVFRNYGIQFLDNFGEWEDLVEEDRKRSIEDIASYKARKVYNVTGLPCIASRTSFEIEPEGSPNGGSNDGSEQRNLMGNKLGGGNNARITSGYRFNNVGDHIDYLVDALLPSSDPCRKTRFRSCMCFYDGEMEIFDYSECDVDIYYCNSLRTYIPMASVINEMCKTLQLAFGLEYQKWLKQKMHEAMNMGYGKASLKLRDRVLKEGRVLPNDIVDVSSFMDSMVDVALMDECGEELAKRFMDTKPSKILTVATTGLVIAIPMAKYLQIPVVYARKERNVVMSDTYQASYSTKTVGTNRELLVSKSHLSSEDRILIIDDFLSSGSSQEALFRIISQSGAKPVGVGVLIEKGYESGRQFLSGFNIPVESMVRIASVQDQIIQLVEEEGYGI